MLETSRGDAVGEGGTRGQAGPQQLQTQGCHARFRSPVTVAFLSSHAGAGEVRTGPQAAVGSDPCGRLAVHSSPRPWHTREIAAPFPSRCP